MDTAKRFFTRLGAEEVNECKTLSKGQMICKQTQPVQLTHLDEECKAQLIQIINSILCRNGHDCHNSNLFVLLLLLDVVVNGVLDFQNGGTITIPAP
jgi:hypothetical protein